MRFRFPAFLLGAALLAGCSISPEQATSGTYLADPSRLELPDLSALGSLNKKQIDAAKGAFSSATLKLRPDRSFVLAGIPGRSQEGKWKLEGDKVTLTPKNPPKGKGVPDAIELTRNPKTNELTFSMDLGLGEIKIVLVKNGS